MLDDVATATRAQLAAALDAAPPPRALMAMRLALRILRPPRRAALPPCAYRGPLITRAPCGCDERSSYQCSAPALAIDGKPAPIIGAVCATCKYRQGGAS